MKSYAFTLGIVPIQDWIAQARRSRDLKAGSAILSWLMARVLHDLARAGATIEVPREPSEGFFEKLARGGVEAALAEDYGIPNRASGMIEAGTGASSVDTATRFDNLQKLVDSSWQELQDRYLTAEVVAGTVSPLLGAPLSDYLAATAGGADCPFSLVWVRIAMEDGASEMPVAELDRLYSDVKRTRPVRPWLWGADVGKCNQCGNREAVGPSDSYSQWREWNDRLRDADRVRGGRRIDPNERLCWVCLTKRLAGYSKKGEPFPSTGEIATRPWRRWVETSGLGEHLSAVRQTRVGRDDLGRALLASEESLRQLWPNGEAEELLAARSALEGEIRNRNRRMSDPSKHLSPTPPGYLALLTYDGDDMGQHVQRNRAAASEAMAGFSRAVARLLAEHDAAPFYLGGDEGLLMAPAESALPLALAIREKFGETFEALDPVPTLSAGIALFEHAQPLGAAITAAHEALRRAKSLHRGERKKNALCVAVETASGSRWWHADHWGTHWRQLAYLVTLIRRRTLSVGWTHDAGSFLRILDTSDWDDEHVATAARAELERLFRRRLDLSDVPRIEAEWQQAGAGKIWSGTAPPEDAEPLHLVAFLARHTPRAPKQEPAEVPS